MEEPHLTIETKTTNAIVVRKKPKGRLTLPKDKTFEVMRSGEVKIKNRGGRPTKFSQELADLICEKLSLGQSLRTICVYGSDADDMPAVSTIFRWFRDYPEFSEQYARAKQESADAMADEILDIADDGRNDWMTVMFGKNEVEMPNREVLARSKLRVDARIWLMSKMKPKKYGGEKLLEPPKDDNSVVKNEIIFLDFSNKDIKEIENKDVTESK